MKKFILISLLCLPLALSMPSAVFAVGPGGACKNDDECDDQGATQYGCYIPSGQTSGTCTAWGDPPGGSQTPPAGTPPGSAGSGQAFVPVSDIPAFGAAGNAPSLPDFLNKLYFYCIGIAVVIAVLQLARAGITYSLADSITSKEEARHLIGASIFGLVLVLSPYLIFKLINPAMLSLNINVSGLQSSSTPPAAPGSGQAGLGDTQNTGSATKPPPFDGSYMDLVEYTGATAQNDINSYSCQNTSESLNKFSNGKTGADAKWYVACVTPNVTYQLFADGLGYPTDDDKTRHDTYQGECYKMDSTQRGFGFGGYTPVPTQDKNQVDCGSGQKCVQGTLTCTSKP